MSIEVHPRTPRLPRAVPALFAASGALAVTGVLTVYALVQHPRLIGTAIVLGAVLLAAVALSATSAAGRLRAHREATGPKAAPVSDDELLLLADQCGVPARHPGRVGVHSREALAQADDATLLLPVVAP